MGIPPGYGQYSLPTMGGGQKDIYNFLKSQFQGGGNDVYQNLFGMAAGKGDIFNQLEIPARRGLESDLANIGMQFGLSGSNKGSGFQNAIAGAGQNFAENIYGERANLMQKSMSDVLNLGNMLLGTPTEKFGLTHQGGMDLSKLLSGGGEALGGILQGIIGKPSTSTDASGKQTTGTDWGQIAGTAAKYLPLLLSLL